MLDRNHLFVPIVQLSVALWEFVVARIKKISQHAIQIKIDEARFCIQEERPVGEHLLERKQAARQLLQELRLLSSPLFQAAPAESALFMPDETQAV